MFSRSKASTIRLGLVVHDGQHDLIEEPLVPRGQGRHLAEVDRGQHVAGQHEEVARMRVRVKKAQLEDLLEDEVRGPLGDQLEIESFLSEVLGDRRA